MHSLVQALLYPRSVAIIGASGNSARLTARPQTFLQRAGYAGTIYPVNPHREQVLGRPAYACLADVPEPVDHATILLDGDQVLQALKDCAKAQVPVVSILADGFAESGAAGARRQQELVAIAREGGITLIGPNSTGVVETGHGFLCTTNAAFAAPDLPTGRFAVLSQSGSMTGAIASRGQAVGLGFKAFVSVGNEAAVGIGELGLALVSDPNIDGFVLFLETLRNPDVVRRFAQAAQAADKPIVAYLVGRSQAGQALAVSHTGAMLGGGDALQAFLRGCGIVLANGFEAMIEMTGALTVRQRLTRRPGSATIVTTTGGGGGMVYDLLNLHGVSVVPMSERVRASLQRDGISVKPGPLTDLTLAGTRYDTMLAVIKALIEDDQTGVVVAAIGSSAQFNPELSVRPIADAVAQSSPQAAPVVAVPIPHAPDSIQLWNASGVPAFRTPESCAEAVASLLAVGQAFEAGDAGLSPECAALLDDLPTGTLDEVTAGKVMHALGLRLPRQVFVESGAALPSDLAIETPWVCKAVSSDLPHKSDVGAVQTDIVDLPALAKARARILHNLAQRAPDAQLAGLLIQQQISGLAQAIVGLTMDPVVGPVVSVGFGGVLTEIYRDVALAPAPVNRDGALQLIGQVKGFAVLDGYRGGESGDVAALADVIVAVSLLARHPRVVEAEINPVIVGTSGAGVTAVDALLRLR